MGWILFPVHAGDSVTAMTVTDPTFYRSAAEAAAAPREHLAYVVAFDRTLVEMAMVRPRTTHELLAIHGMGPSRAERYGEGFLRVLAGG